MITDIFMAFVFGGFVTAISYFCHYIGFKDGYNEGYNDGKFDRKKDINPYKD
jgi:hypothetical protein